MSKYSLILLSSELEDFLESIQSFGMVDITRQSKAIDSESKSMFDLIERLKKAIKELNAIDKTIKEGPTDLFEDNNPAHNVNTKLLESVEHLFLEKKDIENQIQLFEKELNNAELWGEYSSTDLEKIKQLGYEPRFYTIAENKFSPKWEEEYPLHILNNENGKLYFLILIKQGEDFRFDISEAKFPEYSINEYQEKISDLETKLTDILSNLRYIANNIDILHESRDVLYTAFEKYLAKEATIKEGEESISILEGFAPSNQDAQIEEFLNKENIIYLKDKAKEEDNPPIKLKNNFFARLYEPIGELYMLPKYGELDLTPYFAPFYMLFFGLCLGDMGYGIILIIAGLIVKIKAPKFKSYASLIQLLGFGSIIMPMLTGTIFGLKLAEILPLPESINSLFFDDIKMFWFAIIFGVFQIVFAKLVSAISLMITKGIKYGLANLGWAILITIGAFAYAAMEGNELLPSTILTTMAGIGAGLILLFSVTEGNIFMRIIKGITSLWDITSIFGDVLSYIRLFGLGTAGGILGMVVNSIALQMGAIPYIGWLFTGLVLLVGHSAVLFLSGLGAFVHPMRLTFVEFYKNSGFQGGGRAFKAFKKAKNE